MNPIPAQEKTEHRRFDRRMIRRLLNFALPYKKTVMLSLLLLLLAQGLGVYRPKIVQMAIDYAVASGNTLQLGLYTAWFIGFLVIEFICQFLVIYLTQWMGQNIIRDIRVKLFRHITHLHLPFFDRQPVGRLMTRMTSDIETLNELFTSGLVYLLGDLILVGSIIGIMFYLHTPMTLLMLSVLPVLFLLSLLFKKYVRQTYEQVRSRLSAVNAFLNENISGHHVVQLFRREKEQADKFAFLNRKLAEAHIASVFHYAWFFPAINLAGAVAIGLLIWYSGMNSLRESISLGTLIAFIQYAQLFFKPIQDLSDKYNVFQSAMAASERVFETLDTPAGIQNVAQPLKKTNLQGLIEFDRVFFRYTEPENPDSDGWILQDISLRIEPKQSLALVGATGSGKTTLIHLLMRFYEPRKGVIRMDGVDLREYDQYCIRRQMAMVPQDVFLFSGTVMDNIRLGHEAISREQAIQAAEAVGAHRFIERLPGGYDAPVQERGVTFSAGQRQLIALARAFAMNPAILILDEATSNIDTETEQLIQQAIFRLMENRTAIVIAHRLSTIRHIQQVAVLHKGRIREYGTHAELLALGGIYSKLYQLQYQTQETPSLNP